MMQQQKSLISVLLTLGIVCFTVYIVHRFIPSMVWAGIIAIATYPLYQRFKQHCVFGDNTAAALFTFILSLIFILPLSLFITIVIKEGQVFLEYIQLINREGGIAPSFLQGLPWIGSASVTYWDEHMGHPGFLMDVLSRLQFSLAPISYYLKHIGVNLAHRSVQLGFTILTLFFFYRDGERLLQNIDEIGHACLDERWERFFHRLPGALRATVNGTILVGLGVGFCMGTCYALLGFPTPTLTGFITAFAAMIPFAVPLVFLVVALIFLVAGNMIAALVVVLMGTVIMFIADHFVKPAFIGGAIELPFLAVLFGILGGLETLGLLGLFVGPLVLVLFITLCQEFKSIPDNHLDLLSNDASMQE